MHGTVIVVRLKDSVGRIPAASWATRAAKFLKQAQSPVGLQSFDDLFTDITFEVSEKVAYKHTIRESQQKVIVVGHHYVRKDADPPLLSVEA